MPVQTNRLAAGRRAHDECHGDRRPQPWGVKSNPVEACKDRKEGCGPCAAGRGKTDRVPGKATTREDSTIEDPQGPAQTAGAMIPAHPRRAGGVRSASRNLSLRRSSSDDELARHKSGGYQTHGSVKCPVSFRFKLLLEKITAIASSLAIPSPATSSMCVNHLRPSRTYSSEGIQ